MPRFNCPDKKEQSKAQTDRPSKTNPIRISSSCLVVTSHPRKATHNLAATGNSLRSRSRYRRSHPTAVFGQPHPSVMAPNALSHPPVLHQIQGTSTLGAVNEFPNAAVRQMPGGGLIKYPLCRLWKVPRTHRHDADAFAEAHRVWVCMAVWAKAFSPVPSVCLSTTAYAKVTARNHSRCTSSCGPCNDPSHKHPPVLELEPPSGGKFLPSSHLRLSFARASFLVLSHIFLPLSAPASSGSVRDGNKDDGDSPWGLVITLDHPLACTHSIRK
ncbi:hypothetical protein C8F04DRAFT_65744 [Mycena alexandri]|uniref:Uncharacterized protein n=1 Tax=Mycena alexandri TaxID=1745969 RepID=A0AAD6WYT5_9AGAR|nr:hypothetical protein C8F04DRAFT_65744 [Mycena alexandri]